LQDAAATALNEVPCEDAATLTLAVRARIAPDARGYKGTLEMRFSGHSASADLMQSFVRPDFISVLMLDGQALLLPNPNVDYTFTHAMYYDGEKDHWPRVKQAAKCSLDASGRAALITKGQLE
jgi:hypothetical protein